jgi:hypothetical protein
MTRSNRAYLTVTVMTAITAMATVAGTVIATRHAQTLKASSVMSSAPAQPTAAQLRLDVALDAAGYGLGGLPAN